MRGCFMARRRIGRFGGKTRLRSEEPVGGGSKGGRDVYVRITEAARKLRAEHESLDDKVNAALQELELEIRVGSQKASKVYEAFTYFMEGGSNPRDLLNTKRLRQRLEASVGEEATLQLINEFERKIGEI